MNPKEKAKITRDIAASFQKTAIDSLILKTNIALQNLSKERDLVIEDLVLTGGVAANNSLRKRWRKEFSKKYRIHFPTDKKLFCDNAGMIGVAGYYNALRNNFVTENPIQREPNLSL